MHLMGHLDQVDEQRELENEDVEMEQVNEIEMGDKNWVTKQQVREQTMVGEQIDTKLREANEKISGRRNGKKRMKL